MCVYDCICVYIYVYISICIFVLCSICPFGTFLVISCQGLNRLMDIQRGMKLFGWSPGHPETDVFLHP